MRTSLSRYVYDDVMLFWTLSKLMRTSLSTDMCMIKFSWRSDRFFQRCEPNCGKMPYLAMLNNPLKYFSIRIQRWTPSKFNQFFLVHRQLVKYSSWRSDHYVADKQTNRETDKCQEKHDLLDTGNKHCSHYSKRFRNKWTKSDHESKPFIQLPNMFIYQKFKLNETV